MSCFSASKTLKPVPFMNPKHYGVGGLFVSWIDRFQRSFMSELPLRFLLVEGTKDVEETIKLYEERLEKKKLPVADARGSKFLEYFSE